MLEPEPAVLKVRIRIWLFLFKKRIQFSSQKVGFRSRSFRIFGSESCFPKNDLDHQNKNAHQLSVSIFSCVLDLDSVFSMSLFFSEFILLNKAGTEYIKILSVLCVLLFRFCFYQFVLVFFSSV